MVENTGSPYFPLAYNTGCQYVAPMEIELDPAKDEANIAKHGVPLALGGLVIEAAVGTVQDERTDYGEVRMKAFGVVGGRWFGCVYTMAGTAYRIISVHPVRE